MGNYAGLGLLILLIFVIVIAMLIATMGVGYYLGGLKGMLLPLLVSLGFYGYIRVTNHLEQKEYRNRRKESERVDDVARERGVDAYTLIAGDDDAIRKKSDEYTVRVRELAAQRDNMGKLYLESDNPLYKERLAAINAAESKARAGVLEFRAFQDEAQKKLKK